MKILYICPYYKPAYIYGGPVNCISSLCEGLVKVGAQVTVFTTNANGATTIDGALQEPVDVEGVTVRYHPLHHKGLTFFYSPALATSINNHISEFDIVVADSLWGYPLIPAATACKNLNIRYVMPINGQLNSWALSKKKYKKLIYFTLISKSIINRAAGIHCTDESEAEAVEKLGFRTPTFVVPNSINVSSYKNFNQPTNFRMQLGIPGNAMVLLFLGRITRIKRPDIAIDTITAMRLLSPEVHLILAGPDEDNLIVSLKAQATTSDCFDRIHFTGLLNKEAVLSALKASDLLLMPSEIQENFGMAALEALTVGVPILVTEGVPMGRWAKNAGAGRVVACSKQAFIDATIELLSHPEQLKEMGARGQAMASQHFDKEVVARQMLTQYQSIIQTGRPLGNTTYQIRNTDRFRHTE
jgi:glycosyltransferase involved in cell wall biosynthesis